MSEPGSRPKGKVLVLPDFRTPAARNLFARRLVPAYLNLLGLGVRLLMFVSPGFQRVLLPNALRPFVSPAPGILFYGDLFGEVEQSMRYGALHAYAVEADLRLRSQAVFCTEGISVTRLTETRWLSAINDGFLIDLKAIDLLIRQYRDPELFYLGPPGFPVFSALRSKYASSFWWPGFLLALLLLPVRRLKKGRLLRADILRLRNWESPELPQPRPQAARKALFVVQYERTMRRLELLLKHLPEALSWSVQVAFSGRRNPETDAILTRLSKLGARVVFPAENIRQEDLLAIDSQLESKARNGISSLRKLTTRRWDGFDLGVILNRYWESEAAAQYHYASLHTIAAKRALEELRPDAVVHFEEWESNRSFCLLSQRQGIPNFFARFLSPDTFLSLVPRAPDFLLSAGNFMRDRYCEAGNWQPSATRVIGDPSCDALEQRSSGDRKAELRRKYSLPEQQPLALILSSYASLYLTDEMIRRVHRVAGDVLRQKGFWLAVKAHPLQELSAIRRDFSGPGFSFFQSEDLVELSLAADIAVVVNFSSAIPLLAAARCPMMVMVPTVVLPAIAASSGLGEISGFHFFPLEAEGSCYEHFVDKTRHESAWLEAQLRYAELHNGPLDGRSSLRFWNALTELQKKEPGGLR